MIRSKTFIATPPGETIREQLNDREMSQKEFSARMGMSEKHISRLINGEVHLTHEVAERLEMVLGVPSRFWNNLESIYREKIAKVNAENAFDNDILLLKKYPYNEMAKNGWVTRTSNKGERVMNLRKFFEVAQLDYVKEGLIPCVACRRVSDSERADYALIAWTQKARLKARKINSKPINISKLIEEIPEIRSMNLMHPEVFCKKLFEVLLECGIVIVYLPHIGGSFLHGATFYDSDKIVLGLTVRGRDADKFWFSLFHELAHVIKGHINKLSGTSEEDEKEADNFARNILIPDKKFKEFVCLGNYYKHSIIRFAKEIGVDAGIVVGRLQKEGYVNYSAYNDLKTKYTIN